MIMTIDQHFDRCVKIPSDISAHLPTIKQYATGCHYVVELGVRSIVSTWALLAARPKIMVSVDKVHPSKYGGDISSVEGRAKAANIKYRFVLGDDLAILLRGPFDLVFIDTWHVYEQLKQELAIYAPKTRRYIILHDTVTFGDRGESPGHKGLMPAITEFLSSPKGIHWKIEKHFQHSNGLTILSRH